MAQPTGTAKQKTGGTRPTAQTEQTTNERSFNFAGIRIYIGPDMLKKGLRHNMGFRGGLPPEIKAICRNCPAIFTLIVSPAELAAAKKSVVIRGTPIDQAYQAAHKYYMGGE